jgi:hypothetical protein
MADQDPRWTPAPAGEGVGGAGSRWAGWVPAIVIALAAVAVIFGVMDVSSLVFPRDTSSTRPIVVHAQIVEQGASQAHPNLALTPTTLTLACQASGTVTLTDTGTQALRWSAATGPGLSLAATSPRAGLLAPGQRVTLSVRAFGQVGTTQLQIRDDQGETVTLPVQIGC